MARALTFADQFDPGAVDPRLIEILDRAAANFGDYGVEATSGYRKGPRQHGKHAATDVRLRDKKTRAALANYQSPETFGQYEGFAKAARQAQQELYPDLDKQFRWGGYFGGGKDKYGALDLMHFDLGGGPNLGMAGGSWEGGLTPEQAKIWGLPAGTAEALAQQPVDVQKAFLATIAGTEAPAYNTLYGGGTFGEDYAQHPNRQIPIMSGPNKGSYSTAAGRYQFLKPTWDEQAGLAGVKDFSPGSQDKVAWNYAQAVYKQKTGGDLAEALQSGDPARINAAGKELSSVWTSLPGGIEQAKGYGTGTFADAFRKNLGTGGPAGPVEAAGGGAGNEAGAGATPAVGAPVADTGTWWEKLARDFGKGGATVASAVGAQQPARRGPGAIPAARIDQGEVPTIDPQQAEAQRNQLAMALARLNSGRLTG